jgi:hypothetical protein
MFDGQEVGGRSALCRPSLCFLSHRVKVKKNARRNAGAIEDPLQALPEYNTILVPDPMKERAAALSKCTVLDRLFVEGPSQMRNEK